MSYIISAFPIIVNPGGLIPLKNKHAAILVCITCIFTSFTLGFLAGRSTAPGDTIVAHLAEVTESPDRSLPVIASPAETTAPQEDPGAAAQSEETTAVPAESTPPAGNPAESPETVPPTSEPEESSGTGLVNINTATLEQLDTLPGIGPVLAQRIIDYREDHGPFTSLGQLILVDGIGEKKLAAILPLITIE